MIHDRTIEPRPGIPWNVRRATPADLEAILAIQQGSPEAPAWRNPTWRQMLTMDQAGPLIRVCLVAEGENGALRSRCVLGFCVACCAGEWSELESVATVVSARGQGVGRALCREVMAWSRGQGARVMELEVRASNGAAQALYRSLGFADQGVRRNYYQDPVEDAVLMSAELLMAAGTGVLA
ncbi:MAG: GNAT family N-acetyltransferase [Acidobacteriota bacterium]